MTKTTIHFQDLKEPAQGKIWQAVQDELLATGGIEPQQPDEDEAAFNDRLQEAVDHYLNCHNFAQEFCI
ncbi:MAG: hypothetical protein COT71_01030 [Candidatus Andersenbacteria bacterium CG10_big_fil_rev_8_21_14_0_10_54_11]|uniref:Uncharacterized protein n=1 Tax=Candidatus Andersenbacteria bacterium CG10_big_fil_rev_8_21_14_0_10_54_11 TaxID=1974485 RepID=A0A2M6X048_9BACT|nr:MAG: hypothetical protein COT71_01030 [Candidatus Andersenbacteria bacterium CG10_big_fil_rev_8_21_14_0_10_54_11]